MKVVDKRRSKRGEREMRVGMRDKIRDKNWFIKVF